MNAIAARGTSGKESADFVRRAAAVLALGLFAAGSGAAEQEQPAAPEQTAETPAVLKLHEIDFSYRSSSARFTCFGLEGRIASMLRYLGARDDVEVKVTGCEPGVVMDEPDVTLPMPGSDRSQSQFPSDRWRTTPNSNSSFYRRDNTRQPSAHIRVRLMIPVEVTPEVIAELKKDKSRRELAARVRGESASSLDTPIMFPAQRQQMTLSHRTVKLEPEDCQLLQEMSRSVFPKLGMRVVRRGPTCDRDEDSHISPQATVEALMPVMARGPEIKLAPEESGTAAPDPSAPPAPAQTPPAEPSTATPPPR